MPRFEQEKKHTNEEATIHQDKRLLRITPSGVLKLCAVLCLLPIVLRLLSTTHDTQTPTPTDIQTATILNPPLGSLLPNAPHAVEQVFSNDGEMSTHKQRALVLFTLAVGLTILVQITKTLLKLGGFVLALLIIGAVLEALWLIFMTYAWPKVREKVPPMPNMPNMPAMPKLPAINIPFLKKKKAE